MDGGGGSGRFEKGIILETEVVLARTRLSPLAIARGHRVGKMTFQTSDDGGVFLEVGGAVVAEGKIVKKGGRSYFKVARLATTGSGEAEA